MTAPDHRALVEQLRKRADRCVGLCDPGCEGRCKECPADLVRDLLAALTASVSTAQVQALVEQMRERERSLHRLTKGRSVCGVCFKTMNGPVCECKERVGNKS